MNEAVEKVLDTLDTLRSADEMTYAAYSALHDEISLLDDLLKDQETIVRCKDCKYYRYYGPDSYIYSECTIKMTDGPIPTWFCAGGERR